MMAFSMLKGCNEGDTDKCHYLGVVYRGNVIGEGETDKYFNVFVIILT